MPIELSQVATQTQVQTPAWLIEANQVLALSSAELQSLVQKELEENPALELDERTVCSACGRALQGASCPHCLSLASSSLAQTVQGTGQDDAGSWHMESDRSSHEDDEFDPTMLLAARITLEDQLRLEMRAQLPEADWLVIDYLLGNLDGDGYLRTATREVAEICEVSLERVERALDALQAQEPVGVGARTVRECLLLQVRALAAQGVKQPSAYEMVDRYLPQMAEHKYTQIARELRVGLKEVKEAQAFIKSHLHPFPLSGYLGAEVTLANTLASPIQPDVIISCKADAAEERYDVEVVEAQRFGLQISPSYTEAARALAVQRGNQGVDQQHIHDYVKRTRLFIANIKRRWQTLHQITCCLVNTQQAFLEEGVKALHPLTREQIAEELGLHPSTVSRATASKFVMLPNKRVVPFSTFFTANLSLKEALKNLIQAEQKPLSDQKLADTLNAQGWQVARRTIAKYREELKIMASSER